MPESIQKEDWERFRTLGSVPPSIREVVLRSWVRSRDAREVDSLVRAPSVAQDELRALRTRNSRLRSAAKTAIRRAGYMLNDAGMMLLLTDRSGVVMDAEGDARIRAQGEENHLFPGGCWDESRIGTNAIGTALHLGAPVTISGVEHFCEAIQRWSCSAAPIKDPFTGEVMGAIDISGPAGQSFRQVAAFSVTFAMQIEEAMRSADLQEQRRLIGRLLSQRAGAGGDETLVFDRFGRPIWTSKDDGSPADRRDIDIGDLHRVWSEPSGDPHRLAERMRKDLPDAGVDLLGEPGEMLGVIVTLPGPRSAGRTRAEPVTGLSQIAQTGAVLDSICTEAAKIVGSGVSLLIEGPVGSGKETLARALHAEGPLFDRPFEIVDCGLLTADALRGDMNAGSGFMRLAETGGTLCLDEPAQSARAVQPLLAQALAHLTRSRMAAIQVISLSSVGMAERMNDGDLRGDLHFRLAAATLRLPALAERAGDIPGLVRLFSKTFSARRNLVPLRFTPSAMMRLQAHAWPGNLRELRNLIESLSVTSSSGLIDVSDLPSQVASTRMNKRQESLRDRERSEILDAVAQSDGNMTEAARRLGISRSTLYVKLDQYGVPRRKR